jgi:hypothetical protein
MDEVNTKLQLRMEQGLKLMDAHRKASASYYERQRVIKRENGTYRGMGRPKKATAEVNLV